MWSTEIIQARTEVAAVSFSVSSQRQYKRPLCPSWGWLRGNRGGLGGFAERRHTLASDPSASLSGGITSTGGDTRAQFTSRCGVKGKNRLCIIQAKRMSAPTLEGKGWLQPNSIQQVNSDLILGHSCHSRDLQTSTIYSGWICLNQK